MDVERFKLAALPKDAPLALQALWHDAHDDWDAAHTASQDDDSLEGAWVHAYLHRKEGDEANARYWYNRAGQSFTTVSLAQEWAEITQTLLERT